MRIILVAVMSIDGKITAGNKTPVHKWASTEDQRYFSALVKKSRLVIMGRKTFDSAKPKMKLSPQTLRIVLTRKPEAFAKLAVPKQLEFTDESPKMLLKKFEKLGYKEALLVGGAEINATFLRENLVDELWLTIEPLLLGRGKEMYAGDTRTTRLRLVSIRRLNRPGTLLLHYTSNRNTL